MSVFARWDWIKRNWLAVLEEAEKMGLVFVGGTALNLVIFEEYRASEDIDLYNPDSKGPDNPSGRLEEELAEELGRKLAKKGLSVKKAGGRQFYVGPNIKVEIFNDGTVFRKINKVNKNGVSVSVFDLGAYAEMKMAALLCRMVYDPRDLVDVFIIRERGKAAIPMPDRECEIMEHSFNQRVRQIGETSMRSLLLFQSKQQIESLPYNKFVEFKGWLVDWLSEF